MLSRLLPRKINDWQLYLFLLPSLVYIIIFAYIPMAGVQIAFKDYNFVIGIWDSAWVGLKHFERFMDSYLFSQILWNTLSISLYSHVIGFSLPIVFALILNAFINQRFKKIVQTVSYMPHFISTVVIVGMLVQLFNPRTGAFGNLYMMFTNTVMTDLLGNKDAFQHLYVWSGIWQGLGWGSIIYIAALSSVDEHLHEAAQIDGASRFQRVIHIDFPSILPTATILLILSVGSMMDVGFEKVFLMQNELNLSKSEVISTYVYKVGLTTGTGNFSYAAAIGLFNSVINFILLIIVNYAARKWGQTSLW